MPADPSERDKVLLRVIGSPDPYGQQIDGMGGATSSTSKVVIVSKSNRPGCDVDYLFGQVAIGQPLVDWSGNCGNLTSAVGPFSIYRGLADAPQDGMVRREYLAGKYREEDRGACPDEGRRGSRAWRFRTGRGHFPCG